MTRFFVGFLIALLLLGDSHWEATSPMTTGVLFMIGCFFVGIASLGRLWCSLYVAGYKNTSLIVVGPYSVCRNPLYFFSMVGAIGVGLATETFTIPALIVIVFALYYPFVIRHEEKTLLQLHGQEFEAYLKTVPRFWPKWSLLTEPAEYVVITKTFKKHLFSALWFIWIVGILEFIEVLRELKILDMHFSIY